MYPEGTAISKLTEPLLAPLLIALIVPESEVVVMVQV